MGTILLVPVEGKKIDIDEVALKRLTGLARKAKNRGEPMVVTIDGYDVYCTPGTIFKVESDEEGHIKLDITEFC